MTLGNSKDGNATLPNEPMFESEASGKRKKKKRPMFESEAPPKYESKSEAMLESEPSGKKKQLDVRGCGGWVNLDCNGGSLTIHKVLTTASPLKSKAVQNSSNC